MAKPFTCVPKPASTEFDSIFRESGLEGANDESTDITGYAYNGYVDGERVSIRRPRALFFDDISVAFGYVGDLNAPNVFRRLHRLSESNFHRFMLKKNVGERSWISADYTFQAGTHIWREAIRVRTTELRAVDTDEAIDVGVASSQNEFWKNTLLSIHSKSVTGMGTRDLVSLGMNRFPLPYRSEFRCSF